MRKKNVLILFLAMSLLNSCNALKSITDGETELDPEFYIGLDSLFDGLIDFYQFEESGTSNRRSLVDRFDLTTQGRTIGYGSGIRGRGINCGSVGGGPADYYLKNDSFNVGLSSNSGFTFSFWYKPNILSGVHYIFESNGGTLARVYIADNDADATDWGVYAEINGFTVEANNIFTNTTDFRHITVVFSAIDDNVNVYVDGSNSPWTSNGYTPGNYTFNDMGMCSDNTPTQPADGILDSFGMWERELSSNEIYRLYSGANALD